MNMIKNEIKTKNGTATFIWHPDTILENVLMSQVYGFCLINNDQIVLVQAKEEAHFSLPGGAIEAGETAEGALIREFREEVQFIPIDIKLLGSQEVIERDLNGNIFKHHQQIRFFCRPDKIEEFVPEKDGWEIVKRIFVQFKEVSKYIHWVETSTGKAQFEYFLQLTKLIN